MGESKGYREEYVRINGIEHFLLHYAKAEDKPVLLFLHGGPGNAEHLFAYKLDEVWGDVVTQVHWDQRGAGKTQRRNKGVRPHTIEEMLADLHGVVEYLKKLYHKEQVILLGHSWGSLLGSCYVQQHPENVSAYIGSGQVVDMMENERCGFRQVKEQARKAGNEKHLRQLEQLGDYPPTEPEALLQQVIKLRKIQEKYEVKLAGGNIYALALRSPSLRLSDFLSIANAFKVNRELMKHMLTFDLKKYPRRYEVPVHYILGEADATTPTSLSVAYFERIDAPKRSITVLKGAAHSPMFEQPQAYAEALYAALEAV